jgi:hypothetical protein
LEVSEMTDEERETTARVLRERGKMRLERALRKLCEGSVLVAAGDAHDAYQLLSACFEISGSKTMTEKPIGDERDMF